MIRIETGTGWLLVEHREHARLAGRFASHWGNDAFAPPEPRADILVAVARHDDAWAGRDALPFLTREGRPSAFSTELVGRYSAFEEMDFADYLAVRGQAAETVAAANPYAAIIISMHTVDLLTAQADLSGFSEADLELHRRFIGRQRRRQGELALELGGRPEYAEAVAPARLLRAFEFLQACDSLSLATCVRYPKPVALRHTHPRTSGIPAALECTPMGGDTYRITPYPFDADELVLEAPVRRVPGRTFDDEASFRAAYAAAPVERLTVRTVR